MVSQSPREFRDWMRKVERQGVQLRSIPSMISQSADVIREEVEQANNRQPAAPIELTYQTALYTDTSDRWRARFIMDFPDVVKATDATDISVSGYELWGHEISQTLQESATAAVPGIALPLWTYPGMAYDDVVPVIPPMLLQATSTTSGFRVDGFRPGSTWKFKARAIGAHSTVPGVFSDEVTVTMVRDTVAPQQPTAPVLAVQRGTITVTWDGQSVLGDMPADFRYAILAHGDTSSPTKEVARFGRGGGFHVVADIDYYDPQFFRIRAVDESGNLSPWSAQAVGFTTPLVDADVILSTIDAAKTHLINVDAGVSILPNTIITEHLVVTEEMTAAIANFLEVNVDMLNANSIWADEAWFGLADAVLVRSDMFEGKAFVGGTFTGALFQSSVEALDGIKWDAAGIKAWNASGVQTFSVDSATGNVSIGDGTFTGGLYQSSVLANTGVKLSAAGLKIWNTSAQLVLDATPSGATFTGTVRSGFGAVNAQFSEGIYGGRPGLKFVLDTGDAWQPQLMGVDSANGFSNGTLLMTSARASTANGNWYSQMVLSRDGSWQLGNWDGTQSAMRIFGTGANTVRIEGGSGVIQASGSSAFMQSTNSSMQVENNGTASIATTGGLSVFGGLSVSGSKNFVMDHPTQPGMELLHGSTESPVSGIEYWGTGTVGAGGTSVITLPEYFEALAKPTNRTVIVAGNGAALAWSAIVDGKVTVSGTAGTAYSWLVKAERRGGDFAVSRTKRARAAIGPPTSDTGPASSTPALESTGARIK